MISSQDIDIENLELRVREFTDRIFRIKQKLLLKKQKEVCEVRQPSGPNRAITE